MGAGVDEGPELNQRSGARVKNLKKIISVIQERGHTHSGGLQWKMPRTPAEPAVLSTAGLLDGPRLAALEQAADEFRRLVVIHVVYKHPFLGSRVGAFGSLSCICFLL